MPVVNNTQARIELSDAQAEALAQIIMVRRHEGGSATPPMRGDLPPMIWIEETNLANTVAFGGKGIPLTLIHHDGEVHEIGKPAKGR